LSQHKLVQSEIQFLQKSLSLDYKNTNIRLREGEYQYTLANVIASFQLELHFPDVKDIVERLYGEEKANDIQFIRKIQTILKKMQKSDIVQILPKKKPWDLQRYALTCFKFQDVDKNFVTFATESEIKQAQVTLIQQQTSTNKVSKIRIWILVLIVSASYMTSLWTLIQPIVNPIIFVLAFSVAVVCSLMLGKALSLT